MALRFEDHDRAEIGFAIAPQLWGTGVFQKSIDAYLDFLFNEWGVKTLIGKTQVAQRARAGGDAEGRREGDRRERAQRSPRVRLDDRAMIYGFDDDLRIYVAEEFLESLREAAASGARTSRR